MKILYNKKHQHHLILSGITKMYDHVKSYSTSLIDSLDRKKIQKVQINPPVYQISNRYTADLCLDILRGYPDWHTGHVGFDTETTVHRRRNNNNKNKPVSMIQIATRELCFLFQVYIITKGKPENFPPLLQRILTDQNIKKVGVNASGDADCLKKSYKFEMQGVIDLESIAQQKGYAAKSLAELTRMFGDAGLVLEKSKKILKWDFDAHKLDPEVVRYASSDAFAGIQVYENILIDKMNKEYLNYERLHPMNVKEEDDEIYSLILESYPKGKDLKTKTVISHIENRYQRWIKTKPKTNDRRKAALGVIDRLIEDERLIKVLADNSDSNSDEKESPSTDNNFKIRLPGVPFNTILKVYGRKFFELKGLSPQDSEFMIEISSYCLKAIKKDSLAKIISNNGKIVSLDKKSLQVVTNKLNELNRQGALMSGQKWNTLLLHPDWLKELEDGYDEYRLTHAEEDISKEDDTNDKNLEGEGWEQDEQSFEPWKDIDEYDPNDVW